MRHMTGVDGLSVPANQAAFAPPPVGCTGYYAGSAKDFDRAHALDVPQLFTFLGATQPEAFKKLAMANASDAKGILEAVDMDSCRVEKKAVMKIVLADDDAEIDPVQRRHRDLQAVCAKRFVPALCRRHRLCDDKPLGPAAIRLSRIRSHRMPRHGLRLGQRVNRARPIR